MPASYVSSFWDQEPPLSFRVAADDGDGNWTSFLVDANNVPTIRNLIDNGNPTNLNIGDNIWIEPGVKTSIYDYASERIGQTVMIVVVNNDCASHDGILITNFVAFQIEDAEGVAAKTSRAILSKITFLIAPTAPAALVTAPPQDPSWFNNSPTPPALPAERPKEGA